MKLKTFFCFGAASVTLASCVQKAYFTNPGYGNAMPYHTLPLDKDSTKNNLYLNASAFGGSSNYEYNDEQYGLNVNLYNVNTFSGFKVWYGGGLTSGLYHVKKQEAYPDSVDYINTIAGSKFYGSLNGNAGITYALSLGNVEWRILGIQATAQQEFGNYLSFRKQLAKQKIPVNGNTTQAFLLTTGLSSEICIRIPNGSFNISQQYNVLMGKTYRYILYTDYDYNSEMNIYKRKRYDYFTSTYSATIKNMTYFLQANLQPLWKIDDDGPKMENLQFGVNYRFPLRKNR